MKTEINEEYRKWLIDFGNRWCRNLDGSYIKLMSYLFSRMFTYTIFNDQNRASDGVEMRVRFIESDSRYDYRDFYLYLNAPCNVLEMMIALARRCEDHIMGDPDEGDNASIWFERMLINLHLDEMTDDIFDEEYVDQVITNLLNHNYERNGDGGLFSINDKGLDMRHAEIWYQMNWYLNEYLYSNGMI